jgi:hypothetical protein
MRDSYSHNRREPSRGASGLLHWGLRIDVDVQLAALGKTGKAVFCYRCFLSLAQNLLIVLRRTRREGSAHVEAGCEIGWLHAP